METQDLGLLVNIVELQNSNIYTYIYQTYIHIYIKHGNSRLRIACKYCRITKLKHIYIYIHQTW